MAISDYEYILNLDGNCIVKSDTQLTELCNELFEEDKDIAMTKLGAPRWRNWECKRRSRTDNKMQPRFKGKCRYYS